MTTTLPATPPAMTARPAHTAQGSALSPTHLPTGVQAIAVVKRISSAGLMEGGREVEIEHSGRIYRLRITQLNKLILTA